MSQSMIDETMLVTGNGHRINWTENEWPSAGYHLWKRKKQGSIWKITWHGLAVWSLPIHSCSDFRLLRCQMTVVRMMLYALCIWIHKHTPLFGKCYCYQRVIRH